MLRKSGRDIVTGKQEGVAMGYLREFDLCINRALSQLTTSIMLADSVYFDITKERCYT